MKRKFISRELLEKIEEKSDVYQFKKNEIILFQNEYIENLYFIKSGRVRCFLLSSSGKDVTLEVLGPGRFFGESIWYPVSKHTASMEAITDTKIIVCSKKQLSKLMKEWPEFAFEIISLLADTISYLSRQVRRLALMDAHEKVADFLLEVTDPDLDYDLGPITKNSVAYSHQEIAECTNLQRVSVTKILKEFENKGWIEQSYKKVIIINRQALMDFAGKNL